MMSFICVYNNKDILDEYLIKSLNKQTKEHELILVDNRNNEFNSASSALNYGADKANGDYLVFLHQDINLTDTEWIDNTTKQLKKLDNIGIVGVAGKTVDSIVRSNIKQGLDPVDVSPYKLSEAEKASTVDECLFIIPKDVFNKYRLDEKSCDDWHLYAVDYVYNIKDKGYETYIIPSTLEHRSKGYSMSKTYYITLSKLQKKYMSRGLIRTCMGDWFTFIPISIQKFVKKFKKY